MEIWWQDKITFIQQIISLSEVQEFFRLLAFKNTFHFHFWVKCYCSTTIHTHTHRVSVLSFNSASLQTQREKVRCMGQVVGPHRGAADQSLSCPPAAGRREGDIGVLVTALTRMTQQDESAHSAGQRCGLY